MHLPFHANSGKMGYFFQGTFKHQLSCNFITIFNKFIGLSISSVRGCIFSYVLLENLCGKDTVLSFKNGESFSNSFISFLGSYSQKFIIFLVSQS